MSSSGLALTGTFVHNLTKSSKTIFSIFSIYFSLVKNQLEKKGKLNKYFKKLITSSCEKQKVNLAT